MKKSQNWLTGIDEAGRGPLAGPVSVGLVLVPTNFNWNLIPRVGDSKKLSESRREEIFSRTKALQKAGKLQFVVLMVDAKKIDKNGISVCIKQAIAQGLTRILKNPPRTLLGKTSNYSKKSLIASRRCLGAHEVTVKLDGSLKAPIEFVHQETIIKGDAKEKVIGLASIMAKVTRDRYMVKLSALPEFVIYDFARHKGYGTKIHREAISKNGLSTLHRVSYCGNIRIVV